MTDSTTTPSSVLQSYSMLDRSALTDVLRLSYASAATQAVVRVRLWRGHDVYMVPRCPVYSSMISAVRSALRPALHDTASSDIALLNGTDHTTLTKASWPLVFTTLYEVVVKIRKLAPAPLLAPANTFGDIIDLTEDADDDALVQAPRKEAHIVRAPSHIVSADAADDADGEIEVAPAARVVARSPSARPVVRVRGASILPHVRKKMVVRRSVSRSVPTIKTSFGGFPKLHEHLNFERKWKSKKREHWVVVPKAKHALARLWLTDINCDGEGLDPADRTWLGRRRLRCVERDDRKLVDEGPELYNLLVRAHGKQHLCTDRTWRRVRERYVGPSHKFVQRWIKELCPKCKRS